MYCYRYLLQIRWSCFAFILISLIAFSMFIRCTIWLVTFIGMYPSAANVNLEQVSHRCTDFTILGHRALTNSFIVMISQSFVSITSVPHWKVLGWKGIATLCKKKYKCFALPQKLFTVDSSWYHGKKQGTMRMRKHITESIILRIRLFLETLIFYIICLSNSSSDLSS